MDRETFERRRKLGYTDDPACISEPGPRKWRLSLGWQVGLLLAGVCVGIWGLLSGPDQYWLWFLMLGAGCLLALIVLPAFLLYRAAREPAQKLIVEMAVDVTMAKMSGLCKRRCHRDGIMHLSLSHQLITA